jgi:5-methylcytosine-specific restriction enzyme A
MYAVITENDESQWDDHTGVRYHFPAQYKKVLLPGTKVIYYKGRIKDKKFEKQRLSNDPHYFGKAEITSVVPEDGTKNYFALMDGYSLFLKAIPAKIDGQTIEPIPESKKSNYWQFSARKIDEQVYNEIVKQEYISYIKLNDLEKDIFESEEPEGALKKVYTTVYERNKKYRDEAVRTQGYACKVCEFNFKETYGEWGEGYIHVHHVRPLYLNAGPVVPNIETDLIVVCANCHAMIHRRRDQVLTIDELKQFRIKALKLTS